MINDFDDRHERALRDADRPVPLDAAAERRIEATLLEAFDAATDEAGTATDEPARAAIVDLRTLDPDGHPTDQPPAIDAHRSHRRMLLTAAAVVVAVVCVGALLGRAVENDDRRLDLASPEAPAGSVAEATAAEVRAWCVVSVPALRARLDSVTSTDDPNTDTVDGALTELADAAQGLFDVVDEHRDPTSARRLDEIGRIGGEAVALRQARTDATLTSLADLANRLHDEAALVSNDAPMCEIVP